MSTVAPQPTTTENTDRASARRNWFPPVFRASFWIEEDPNPEYSRLDRADGLTLGATA